MIRLILNGDPSPRIGICCILFHAYVPAMSRLLQRLNFHECLFGRSVDWWKEVNGRELSLMRSRKLSSHPTARLNEMPADKGRAIEHTPGFSLFARQNLSRQARRLLTFMRHGLIVVTLPPASDRACGRAKQR
jgi:hypothetical protein